MVFDPIWYIEREDPPQKILWSLCIPVTLMRDEVLVHGLPRTSLLLPTWICSCGVTLPETNIVPEKGWLGDEFPFGARPIFRGELLVSERVRRVRLMVSKLMLNHPIFFKKSLLPKLTLDLLVVWCLGKKFQQKCSKCWWKMVVDSSHGIPIREQKSHKKTNPSQ